MEKLKPCPFCGVVPDGLCEIDGLLGHVACLNHDCEANNFYMPFETWQKRPIESAMQADVDFYKKMFAHATNMMNLAFSYLGLPKEDE